MIVKLLTEHHLEFLRLKGDCRGSCESTNVKMPNCWKSHDATHTIDGNAILQSFTTIHTTFEERAEFNH